jgi:hypothetical protein
VTDEVGAVRKVAKQPDIEVVAAFFGGELAAWDDAMPPVSGRGLGLLGWPWLLLKARNELAREYLKGVSLKI